jgi:hypothetical protein
MATEQKCAGIAGARRCLALLNMTDLQEMTGHSKRVGKFHPYKTHIRILNILAKVSKQKYRNNYRDLFHRRREDSLEIKGENIRV